MPCLAVTYGLPQVIYEARDLDLPQNVRDGLTQGRADLAATKARVKASESRIDSELEPFVKRNYWQAILGRGDGPGVPPGRMAQWGGPDLAPGRAPASTVGRRGRRWARRG